MSQNSQFEIHIEKGEGTSDENRLVVDTDRFLRSICGASAGNMGCGVVEGIS